METPHEDRDRWLLLTDAVGNEHVVDLGAVQCGSLERMNEKGKPRLKLWFVGGSTTVLEGGAWILEVWEALKSRNRLRSYTAPPPGPTNPVT